MTFENLNLIEPISQALKTKGYVNPTPIQEKAIPQILQGHDVFGCAQTGTGKTAAFALPILQMLHERSLKEKKQGIKALILAPTRELAIQIDESFTDYGKGLSINHTVIFGGVSQHNQTNALRRGVDIVIATPGRLLDLMHQGHVKLNNIEFFVLDEVDRMLDMGFINDIKKIIAKIPAKRQTIFLSATIPGEIRKLADSLLQNPVKVEVAAVSAPAEMVTQAVYYVEKADKRALLQQVLKDEEIDHALVFTRTKHGADKVVKDLNKNGIRAEAIHGNKSQNARQKALIGFKNRTIRILVATDIASRGIDVDKLTHVINYELPEVPETYVHRIGRTGRAGEAGTALSFCASEEMDYLRDINKLLKKNIALVSTHSTPTISKGGSGNRPAANSGKKFFRRRSY
ncbi:MAG: DEAD/DEAH box helicase [Bacteroidia bacterium]|nr:DEAD/DEAH box helicase [Bacteroidia bacterium]